MNPNLKILIAVAAAILVYHYFFKTVVPILPTAKGNAMPDADLDADSGKDDGAVVAQVGNGTAITNLVSNMYGSGQDNQASMPNTQRAIVLER